MTGPRDLSGVWDAVFAAAYVRDYHERMDRDGHTQECLTEIAALAAAVADEAVRALHRAGGEP